MKYESELIKQIIDDRGHKHPPIHYQSECINEWIKEAEGSYPKLTDYESEWLNYIVENRIGAFPYVTLNDVTNATVNNVVPYAYKSAILKGCTLVNLFNDEVGEPTAFKDYNIISVKENTKYIIFTDITTESPTSVIGFVNEDGTAWKGVSTDIPSGISKRIITTGSGATNKIRFHTDGMKYTAIINRLMVLEYQEGMENWDIPYFTGMQSVKMPVLTTTTSQNLSSVPFSFFEKTTDRKYGAWTIFEFDNLFSGKIILNKSPFNNIMYFDTKENRLNIGTTVVKDVQFIGFYNPSTNIENNNKGNLLELLESGELDISLQENGKTNVYSYKKNDKTNILTVNDDVTLRGIGDVRDTLDCLTGELTERIGEVVLDGSEGWMLQTKPTDVSYSIYRLSISGISTSISNGKTNCISDKAKCSAWTDILKTKTDKTFAVLQNQQLRVQFNGTVEELKEWLKETTPTVKYIKEKVVKTVDLTIKNQDGETLSIIKPIEGTMTITTDGSPIKPTFTGEIPVEAITQNLASFIEGE